MALRRDVLSEVGDFDEVTDFLADDYQLGCAVRRLGLQTVVAPFFVETVVAEDNLYDLAQHELRWMSTIRSVQPIGYAFSVITCGITMPLLGVFMSDGAPSLLCLLGGAFFLRFVLHCLSTKPTLTRLIRSVWLLPMRDLFVFGLWTAGFFYRFVNWREKAIPVNSV